jgi:hypothetical protein
MLGFMLVVFTNVVFQFGLLKGQIEKKIYWIIALNWLITMIMLTGIYAFYWKNKDYLVYMLHLITLRNISSFLDLDEKIGDYTTFELMCYIIVQMQGCWMILFMIAIHQKRSILKTLSLLFYNFLVVFGALVMLTKQKDIKDSLFTIVRDYWLFVILLSPAAVSMFLFMS